MARLTRLQLLERSLATGVALSVPGLALPGDAIAALSGAAATPKRGGRLRVGFVGGGGSESLDPGVGLAFVDFVRGMNLFDRLTPRSHKGNFPPHGPGLASAIEPNKDGSVWNLKLRQGVEFHNGKTLTADDIVYSFRRWLDPKSGINDYGLVKGLINPKTTRKLGKYEVRIGMVTPTADLASFLQGVGRSIVPDGITKKELTSHPIGTGPFKFVSFRPGQQSLFARHENYFVDGKPYLDELEIIDINDASARLNALVSGQIDAMGDLDYTQAAANKNNSKIKILSAAGANVTAFYLMQDHEPFKDVRVRTAFKLAVDRQAMVNIVYRGFGSVANDIWGPGWPSYNTKLPQRKYDPERAKALLKAAGHDRLDVTLYTSTALLGMLESAQAYVEQAKPAGIHIKLKQIPAGDYFNTGAQYLKQPFYQTSWGGGSFETVFSYANCKTPNEINWCDPAWDKRFAKAQGTLNAASRYAQLKQLQVEVWNKSGYIVWGYGDHLDAVSPKVMGFTPSYELPFGDANFKNFWLA